jgi:NADH:ubiquinone oxidoreductase subunit K
MNLTPVGVEHYLVVSGLLFTLGLLGVIMRRNVLVMYMCLELMLNAANLALVAMSRFNGNASGQIVVFFIIIFDHGNTVVVFEIVGRGPSAANQGAVAVRGEFAGGHWPAIGRAEPDDGADRDRRGQSHPHLFGEIPGRRPRVWPLFREPEPVHLLDAGNRVR